MEVLRNKQLCRFQNIGFCRYEEKCFFRHVENVCQKPKCPKINCSARHLKKCKFFLRNKCKFKNKCEFAHDANHKNVIEAEAIEKEVESLKREVKKLEKENEQLLSKIKEQNIEVEKLKLIKKNFEELSEVNKVLIDDVRNLNNKLKAIMPGAQERENESLKETVAILQAVIDIYKQAEIDEEGINESNNIAEQIAEMNEQRFRCDLCYFESDSSRGLSVHVGMKHRKLRESNREELLIDI